MAILTEHVWYLLCWWISKWSDTAANPVSLGLIRFESSCAGALADIARKGEQGLKKILRNVPTHYSPSPALVHASQRCRSIPLANRAHLFISLDSSSTSQTTVKNVLQTPQQPHSAASLPKATICLPPKTSFQER